FPTDHFYSNDLLSMKTFTRTQVAMGTRSLGTQPNGAPNPKAPLGGGTRGTTKQIANTRRTHIKRRSCFLLIQGLESLIIPYKAVYASFTYLDAKKVTNEDFYALDIQPEFITSRCSPRTRKGWSSGGCLMG